MYSVVGGDVCEFYFIETLNIPALAYNLLVHLLN